MIKPGENPRRVLPRHEERGKVAHTYTLHQIAEAAGVRYQTVRRAVSAGKLDPSSLRSVAAYVMRSRERASRGTAELVDPRWANRWPRFELYLCPEENCDTALLYPGFCPEHGGIRRPPLRLADDHVEVLVGDSYVPLHRLIAQTPRGFQTHHRDGNPFNNRLSNLESLTPEEHLARHVGGILSAPVVKHQPPRKPLVVR